MDLLGDRFIRNRLKNSQDLERLYIKKHKEILSNFDKLIIFTQFLLNLTVLFLIIVNQWK